MKKYNKVKLIVLFFILCISIVFFGNRVVYAAAYYRDNADLQNNAKTDILSGQIGSQKEAAEAAGSQLLSSDEQEVFDLVNKEREKANLPPLVIDANLQKIVELKAEDMVSNNYFSHQSAVYGSAFDMMKDGNIWYRKAGENLAGNINNKTAVSLWINSKSHRDNILWRRVSEYGDCSS
ncbi:MAG: CAP domain-containing protein [Firmicutes bacterium]|nr:CAP domain-containing protein [Bacillota bacterium]